MLLFKGDKIVFKRGGDFQHNLVDLKSAAALESCDESDHTVVANVEQLRSGHLIEFMGETSHFYSCTFPNHCTMGQILTVEVKSATDGMRCHSDHDDDDGNHHGHDHGAGHDHGSPDDDSSQVDNSTSSACAPPMVTARLIGSYAKSYGAGKGECVEMCTSKNAMKWMTGVVEAACGDSSATGGSFPEFVIEKEVLPNPRSPPMTVHIHRKKLDCHCHSYEEIECNAPGTANPLYDEHIAEITEHCAGVLDGTITDCPYKCFQPFEVLHLHYMDCILRPKDAMYLQIEKKDLCHQASRPPAGAACEDMTKAVAVVNDDDDTEVQDDKTESVAAAGLMLAAFFVK
jgi:hypothetical protein